MRDGIRIKLDASSRALHSSEKTGSGTSRFFDLVNRFREKTMHSFSTVVHEIAVEGEENVPGSVVWTTYVRLGYTLGGYILTLRDVRLERRCFRELGKYTRRSQQVFRTDRY